MNVAYLRPPAEIAGYVQEILVMEHHPGLPFVLPLFANGMPTLLFHSAKGKINNQSNYLTLFGQTISPSTLTINENFTLLAYFLKPNALRPLFGLSPKELADKPIDLNLLPSCRSDSCQEKLLSATSTKEMMAVLTDFLARLIARSKTDDQLISYATAKISATPFGNILRDVQNDLYLSERSFQRRFSEHIGVTPGQFRRICQFNNAFQHLNRQRSEKLADITFRYGFSDQSHFIRTFKEFTQLTPSHYLNFGTTGNPQ